MRNHPSYVLLFTFTLLSRMVNLVVILHNKVTYKDKFISVIFKCFQHRRQCLGGMLGIVVAENDTAGLNLADNPLGYTVRGGIILPVKRVNTPLNGLHTERLDRLYHRTVIIAVGRAEKCGCDTRYRLDFFVAGVYFGAHLSA